MKTAIPLSIGALLLLGAALPVLCQAELLVSATTPRISGDTAVVTVEMRNGFEERIEAARAAVFLLDERGKVLEHSVRWVIGGSKDRPGLAAGATNVFIFVLPTKALRGQSNISSRVVFSRLVLPGGKLADVNRQVRVSAVQRGE